MQSPAPTLATESVESYLASHGFPSVIPHIRSSDDWLLRSSPFVYYLQRRLGLVDPLTDSEALRRGSWFHKAADLLFKSPKAQTNFREATIETRLGELAAVLATRGITGVSLRERNDELREDATTAFAWFDAAMRLPVGTGNLRNGLLSWLTENPNFYVIASEYSCEMQVDQFSSAHKESTQGFAVFDVLLFSKADNSVWVLDWKTTDKKPTVRLATVPFEFQTLHYCELANASLQKIIKDFGLPTDARFGGMIHVAIQKPEIRLSGNDRDYTEAAHTLKSGPRKGEIEMRRTYHGDPKPENFTKRVLSWMQATGDYAHLASEVTEEPRVNVSWTHYESSMRRHWLQRLKPLTDAATLPAEPHHFDKTPEGILSPFSGKVSVYAPFHTIPPRLWPDLIKQKGLTVSHRN